MEQNAIMSQNYTSSIIVHLRRFTLSAFEIKLLAWLSMCMQGEQKFENNKAFQSYWLFERNCIRCKLYNAQWVTSRPYSTFKAKKKKFVHFFKFTFIDFDFQFALEKRNGLPFASFMDPDQVKKASMQIGFIRFVLIPLFEALSKVLMII